MQRSMFTWIAVCATAVVLFGASLASGVSAQGSSDDPAQVEAGQAVFELNCAGCHGSDGAGTSQGRPLTGIADQQPDRGVHIMSVTDGKGRMPAFGERLSAEEIDAAVSYVRLTFVAPEPTPEPTPEPDEADADADDEAAATEETSEAPELALTGVETGLLAVGGLTLVAAGALVTHHGRRIRQD